MLEKGYEAVKEFHKAFNAPVGEEPHVFGKKDVRRRVEWMNEEITEFIQAENIYEQCDALTDLIYFALGTFVEMGVNPDKLFNIVQEANMSKLWADGKARYREDGKILKPETWVDPEPKIRAEIDRQSQRE